MFKAPLPATRVIARRLYSTRGKCTLWLLLAPALRVLTRRQRRNPFPAVQGVRSGTQLPQPTLSAGQLAVA